MAKEFFTKITDFVIFIFCISFLFDTNFLETFL